MFKLLFIALPSVALLPILVQSNTFECHEEGRFAVPDECQSYAECVTKKGSEGVFLDRRNLTCPKGAFSAKEGKCVALYKVPECDAREPRMDTHRADLDYLCGNGSDFVCGDCRTVVHCLNNNAYVSACTSNDFCHVKESYGGAVCYPDEISECECSTENYFMRDKYDEKTFYYCSEDLMQTLYKCAEDMVFSEDLQQCTNNLGLPPCIKAGVFADKSDCSHYYTCIQVETGYVQKKFTCPEGEMYSDVNGRCEDPCNWVKGEFFCTEEGRFKDVTNCGVFYECIGNGDDFRLTKRFCPSNSHWEQSESGNTGKCVRQDEYDCKELTLTECDIPEGWCPAPSAQTSAGNGTYVEDTGNVETVETGETNEPETVDNIESSDDSITENDVTEDVVEENSDDEAVPVEIVEENMEENTIEGSLTSPETATTAEARTTLEYSELFDVADYIQPTYEINLEDKFRGNEGDTPELADFNENLLFGK